jgi:hypothetical protein
MATYADDTLVGLVKILERACEGLSVAPCLLARDLGDLFDAVGLSADDSEDAQLFRELSKGEPTHADLAKVFRRIARARNPFADKAGYDLALPELNAKARVLWAQRVRRAS